MSLTESIKKKIFNEIQRKVKKAGVWEPPMDNIEDCFDDLEEDFLDGTGIKDCSGYGLLKKDSIENNEKKKRKDFSSMRNLNLIVHKGKLFFSIVEKARLKQYHEKTIFYQETPVKLPVKNNMIDIHGKELWKKLFEENTKKDSIFHFVWVLQYQLVNNGKIYERIYISKPLIFHSHFKGMLWLFNNVINEARELVKMKNEKRVKELKDSIEAIKKETAKLKNETKMNKERCKEYELSSQNWFKMHQTH